MDVSEFAIPQIVRHKPTGDLLITRERYPANKWGNNKAGYRCAPIGNRNTTMGYPDEDLELPPPRKPGEFDYDMDIVPRAQGALEWEHVEPARLDRTLSNIAACAGWVAYPEIAWVKKPGAKSASWARLFLHLSASGKYTGEAHALVWENGTNRAPQHLRDAVISAAVEATHNPKVAPGNLAAAVLAMESAHAMEKESPLPSAWLLSICKHEIVDSSTPEGRMRGWHPAHCSKCGLNLSIDSSD
jgi:hypothetical protein